MLQVSPFGEWSKLKIYNCIVFTGFKPQNFIFLKVSAGGLVLTYSSARYSYKHLYKVYCYRKKSVILKSADNIRPLSHRYYLVQNSSTPYVVALLFIPPFSSFEHLIFLWFTQFGGKFSDTALLNSDSNSLSSFSGLP